MIYYSLLYMDNGEIHLKPHGSKELAESCIDKILKHEKWGPMVVKHRVLTKDDSKAWFKKTGGYWVS